MSVAAAGRWRFTVDDFHRMGTAGIFRSDDRVELIEGEVRSMSPIGPRHAGTVKQLVALLSKFDSSEFILSVQDPLRLSDCSEPVPDLMLLRARDDYYRKAHPTPDDVLLVIEVADTTLGSDRREKIPLYAREMIPEAWLVDVARERIVQFSDPQDGEYRSIAVWSRGQTIVAKGIAGLALSVDEILGRAGDSSGLGRADNAIF